MGKAFAHTMPLLKRKPLFYQPLPSLTTVLQPISHASKDTESTPPPAALPPPKSKKSKAEPLAESEDGATAGGAWVPPDGDNDEDQLQALSRVFEDGFVNGSMGKGKKAGTWIVNGSVNFGPAVGAVSGEVKQEDVQEGLKQNGEGSHPQTNGTGEMLPPPAPGAVPTESWKITDREVFYIPETGEIFTDYECVQPSYLL